MIGVSGESLLLGFDEAVQAALSKLYQRVLFSHWYGLEKRCG